MASKLRIGPGVKILDEPLKSISEFDNWKHSVLYNLRLDGDFALYLEPDFEFGIKSKIKPHRNLRSDTTGDKKTAAAKCSDVDFMLEQIAQFCPKIPHNDITKDCGSLEEVWQTVRLHSNIETSGALLNECWNMTRNSGESPQALYSRLKQAYDENLIRKDTLFYKNKQLDDDEELSPTLHCSIILHWLQILHPKLRDLVTQKFGTELRRATYAALFPEISRSIDSLLKELSNADDGSICKFGEMSVRYPPPRMRGSYSRPRNAYRSTHAARQCDYCRILGKRAYNTHSIEDCLFLKREKQSSTHGYSKAVEADDEYEEHRNEYYDDLYTNEYRLFSTVHYINRVSIHASPVLVLYHSNKPYNITLDTGGTCNVIPRATAEEMRCRIRHTYQRARMADGDSELDVVGETDVEFQREGKSFRLTALVCSDVSESTVLAGMPFLSDNDIAIRPAKAEIIIDGTEVVKYDPQRVNKPVSCRISNYTVRSPVHKVILPGESAIYQLPPSVCSQGSVVVEPRLDSVHNRHQSSTWPQPRVYDVSNGTVSLVNSSTEPVAVKKHEHICLIQEPIAEEDLPQVSPTRVVPKVVPKKSSEYSSLVNVNPDDVLTKSESAQVTSLLLQYDEVFNPVVSGYNGRSGACYVEVNMGPNPPPQHKGKVPFYGRNNMIELQDKFDNLTSKGVFCRPQDIGVTIENINPSFLVKKASSNDKRLVTDFGSISSYCRPTPTLMPDVDSTLRQIASWKYIIKTDLTEAYFQIPLKKSSMKYCGVVSPMKGNLVYTVGCMGLPGTEVALEELTCLLFGELVKQGKVAKLADDLFIGASNPQDLIHILEEVLGILLENNLRLSAKKTIIAPKSVMILGWIWSGGYLKASSHRLSALSESNPPETVSAMKSFIGAYRFLSRVIRSYASLLIPLEEMIAGKPSGKVKLEWSDVALSSFRKAQLALKDPKAIVLPVPEDTLWIVTDAAIQPTAIAATLYAVRDGKPYLAGFYNAKLPVFQRRWLPCEVEGVAIGASLKHYAPYIIQSNHKPCVLTDSKACVQAIEKLKRGEYSTSARLCTFLSSVSRYEAEVKHISGVSNLTSDYISRNPVPCTDPKCQVCKFLQDSMSSVIATITVSDVLEGRVQLPFSNRRAWMEVQNECPDLRRVFKYLQNGTSPGKKGKNLRLVKRYLTAKVVISSEGSLVVRHLEPLHSVSERVVIPQQVLHGILTVLHLRLGHPTNHQLRKVVDKHFFALNLDGAISQVSNKCHQCFSIKDIPKSLIKQSTEEPPGHMGERFAADIIKRHKQNILVLRECVSSFTLADLIPNETAAEVSNGLLRLCNLVRPSSLFPISIRVDPASSHQSLFSGNNTLKSQNIHLEVGRVLNKNKNPVAEKAIREIIREILIISPEGGTLSSTSLSQAVANLNARLRASGMSAYELFTQRDQTTGVQIRLDDETVIAEQHKRRVANHKPSEKCKAGNKPSLPAADIKAGSVVYLYSDGSKVKARPRYIVLSVSDGWCSLRRLTDKLLGHKTYSAKLEEVYKVPDETEGILPEYHAIDSSNQLDDLLLSSKPQATNPDENPIVTDPCSMCQKQVGEEDEALQCDQCLEWCHRECTDMSKAKYRDLMNVDDFEWSCPSHLNDSISQEEAGIDNHEESSSAEEESEPPDSPAS